MGELAEREALMVLPAVPFPATIVEVHRVDDWATVAFRGNRYSVNPGLGGSELSVSHRLGTTTVEIFTPAGALLVAHRLAPPRAGMVVRTSAHRVALETAVLSQFSTARPCDRKAKKPPGQAALAERAKLLGAGETDPAVDLAALADIVARAFPGRTTLPGGQVSA